MYHSNKSNNGSKPINRERPCGVHIDCILHVGDFAAHLCTCTCLSLCSNRVKECKSHTQKRERKNNNRFLTKLQNREQNFYTSKSSLQDSLLTFQSISRPSPPAALPMKAARQKRPPGRASAKTKGLVFFFFLLFFFLESGKQWR